MQNQLQIATSSGYLWYPLGARAVMFSKAITNRIANENVCRLNLGDGTMIEANFQVVFSAAFSVYPVVLGNAPVLIYRMVSRSVAG